MTLGERIKEQRKKNGFSQEKIAELTGTSRQAVTKWESGQSVPCMENLLSLSEIFGVSLNDLTNGACKDVSPANENATAKKSPILLDIIFVLVALVALCSIFRIPTYLGFSMVGFLFIVIQVAAVIYVPLYLLWIRPKRVKNDGKNNNTNTKSAREIKKRISAGISAGVALFAGYLLCGHVFFFLHGMGQWPLILFGFGLIVICFSAFADAQKVMIGTVTGYLIGFAIGMIFGHTYYMYVGNELWIPRHNAWSIWTGVYLIFIALGIVCEFLAKRRRKDSQNKFMER